MTTSGQVHIRFFAALREQLNCSELVVTLTPEVVTIGQLRAQLIAQHPEWAGSLGNDRSLRMAYQQVMCDAAQVLDPSALRHEVAFFPPVTGG